MAVKRVNRRHIVAKGQRNSPKRHEQMKDLQFRYVTLGQHLHTERPTVKGQPRLSSSSRKTLWYRSVEDMSLIENWGHKYRSFSGFILSQRHTHSSFAVQMRFTVHTHATHKISASKRKLQSFPWKARCAIQVTTRNGSAVRCWFILPYLDRKSREIFHETQNFAQYIYVKSFPVYKNCLNSKLGQFELPKKILNVHDLKVGF